MNTLKEILAPPAEQTVLGVIRALISVPVAWIPSVSITVSAIARLRPIFLKISV